jgi:putative endonuclease
MKDYFVYILASKRNGTLYVGVTNDLLRRAHEHRADLVKGFTKRYGVRMLVYYEQTSDVYAAIQREKAIKKWRRIWKLELIERHNPQWVDLWNDGEILPLPRDTEWGGRSERSRASGPPLSRG